MIQVTSHMRIVAAVEAVDFRKGIDSLAALCRKKLQSDPFSGALFVFVNKSRQAMRIINNMHFKPFKIPTTPSILFWEKVLKWLP